MSKFLDISSRKAPQQARSNELVAAVLDAAVQVLQTEGAHRFTTARVAERAGVSVGSLYQYFPNKGAILFRLQSDEWHRTFGLLQAILEDESQPPSARLRKLAHAFIWSECQEAAIRLALTDTAPFYRDAPEVAEAHAAGVGIIQAFLRKAAPAASEASRAIAGDILKTALCQVGVSFSASPREPEEIGAFAEGLADMFCAYLDHLSA